MTGHIVKYLLKCLNCCIKLVFLGSRGKTPGILGIAVCRSVNGQKRQRGKLVLEDIGVRQEISQNVKAMGISSLYFDAFGGEKGQKNFLSSLLRMIGIISVSLGREHFRRVDIFMRQA